MIDKSREIKKIAFNNVEASIKASTSWSVCYIHHSVYYNKKIEKSFSNFLSYQNCLLSPMIHQFTLDSFMRKSSVNLKLQSVELTEVRFWLPHTFNDINIMVFLLNSFKTMFDKSEKLESFEQATRAKIPCNKTAILICNPRFLQNDCITSPLYYSRLL